MLAAWGDADPFFTVEQGERTAAAARHGELSIHPGAGHFLPSERPAQLARDIRALAAAQVTASRAPRSSRAPSLT